jgi:uncharacterized membrane protein
MSAQGPGDEHAAALALSGVRVRFAFVRGGVWLRVSQQWLLGVAALLAVAGVGIATYLTVVHYADQPIACSSIGDCELVNSSRYAKIGGVPVALLGAAAYASMLLLVASSWLRRSQTALTAAWGIALASFGFSMYLTYVELRVLDAICVYCVAQACVMTALLAVLSLAMWRSSPDPQE